MLITPIKTPAVKPNDELYKIIKAAISRIREQSVLVVTSKIVSLCEGRVADPKQVSRDELVPKEADLYLPREENKYGFCLSVKFNTLIASAGIDESNADGQYVLWPENPQQSANEIRDFLIKTYLVKDIGVIITDSHVLPLRWGTQGTAIAHSGFKALNNYVGKPDIFGRKLKVTRANVAEGLAAAAVVCMGEGAEQTPLALVENANFVQFQRRSPTKQELDSLKISLEEDIYAPILTKADWQKGGST